MWCGRPLRRLSAMSLLILRTGLAGVPGDAVGGEPGGVGGARRPRFPGSPCFSAPPRSRASPRPSRSKGHCGSGRRLRAVPRGRPATGGRAAAGASWAAATRARLAKATVRLAFIWPASAGEYGGGQPISTVRRCRKDHPAARCITGLLSLSLRPGTTGSEGGGAGPLGNGSGKRHGLTLCGCRAGYGGAGVVSPGGDGGGSGRGGDGGTGHGRVIRDCRRGDASAVAGRLAAGAQPQENQGEGDGEGDDDRPDPEGLGVAGGEGRGAGSSGVVAGGSGGDGGEHGDADGTADLDGGGRHPGHQAG